MISAAALFLGEVLFECLNELQLSVHSLSHASRASSLREGAFWSENAPNSPVQAPSLRGLAGRQARLREFIRNAEL